MLALGSFGRFLQNNSKQPLLVETPEIGVEWLSLANNRLIA